MPDGFRGHNRYVSPMLVGSLFRHHVATVDAVKYLIVGWVHVAGIRTWQAYSVSCGRMVALHILHWPLELYKVGCVSVWHAHFIIPKPALFPPFFDHRLAKVGVVLGVGIEGFCFRLCCFLWVFRFIIFSFAPKCLGMVFIICLRSVFARSAFCASCVFSLSIAFFSAKVNAGELISMGNNVFLDVPASVNVYEGGGRAVW